MPAPTGDATTKSLKHDYSGKSCYHWGYFHYNSFFEKPQPLKISTLNLKVLMFSLPYSMYLFLTSHPLFSLFYNNPIKWWLQQRPTIQPLSSIFYNNQINANKLKIHSVAAAMYLESTELPAITKMNTTIIP